MKIAELKARYSITRAWGDLGLPGQAGRCVPSPLRQDRNPSFSVWTGLDGVERFKDFATGASGDVLELVKEVRRCDLAQAIRFVEERVGVAGPARTSGPPRQEGTPSPAMRRGTAAEIRELCARRGFGPAGIQLAEDRGLLFFTRKWGLPAWCVSDQRGQLAEFRRLDGAKWPAYGRLPERKAHCIGTGKRWPLGTLESLPYPKVAMVEGAPDLLAACHFIVAEAKVETVAPVAVLGASNHHLDPDALVHFKGKVVCLFPHLDDAGRMAARQWALALRDAGAARVTAFDLSGNLMADGLPGKDLADAIQMDPDTWERERKFREVLP